MPAPRAVLVALVTLALLGSGCGAQSSGREPKQQAVGGGGGDNELSASDTADVLGARRTIDDRCGGTVSIAPSSPELTAAVQTLVGITQLYPGRVYETGSVDRAQEMRTVARDVGAELRACGIDAEAQRLDRVAATA